MPHTFTKEEFIEKANIQHRNKYGYDKTVYVNSTTKITITCPIHGDFQQRPGDHVRGSGCKKCSVGDIWDTYSFVNKATKIHNNFYSYDKVVYTNNKTKVIITCPIHGDFLQAPTEHINAKQGCKQCGTNKVAVKQTYTTGTFIEKANQIHKDLYDYSNTIYQKFDIPVEIICKKHGPFWQKPGYHLGGSGCQECGKELGSLQFNPLKPTIMYFVYFPDHSLYKVGITNRSVQARFYIETGLKYTIIEERQYKTGYLAWKAEQKLLKDNIQFRYDGPSILHAGNSELFTRNVLFTQKELNEN